MATGATRLLGPRKTIDETLASTELETHRLRRNLGTFDVVVLGVGAMVGAGIFVLTGAPVPHAGLPGGPDPGDSRRSLPRGDAAGRHLDPLRRVDGAQARGLRGVRARLEPGGRGSGAREHPTQLGDRRPGALDDVAPRERDVL